MHIFLLNQNKFNGYNVYDTYDSCVVIAYSKKDAVTIHPNGGENIKGDDTWPAPEFVTVKWIGIAKQYEKRGVVCASFNAG